MKTRGKGKRLWETGRHVQVDICSDEEGGFVATIGPVSLWLKKEEAQDMVATLTRALMRSAAMEGSEGETGPQSEGGNGRPASAAAIDELIGPPAATGAQMSPNLRKFFGVLLTFCGTS